MDGGAWWAAVYGSGAEGETDGRSDQHTETSLPLPELLESFLIHAFK